MEIVEEHIVRRYIEFDGIRFYPDRNGYWLGARKDTKKPVRLHIYVWEHYNGPVPKGYHVHHIDHNPDNNEIENLQLLSEHEHLCLHAGLQRKAIIRENLLKYALPAAAAWHGSEEGRKWHSVHGKRVAEKTTSDLVTKVCQVCGKEYQVPRFCSEGSRFCSNNCKSQWRRDSGLDNIEVKCEVCGAPFWTNKYARARFCSKDCRLIANRARWDKILEERRNAKNIVGEG